MNTPRTTPKASPTRQRVRVAFLLVSALAIGAAVVWRAGEAERMSLKAVRERLKDPESARFTNVRKVASGHVCGLVNARNGLGGYVGNAAFIVSPPYTVAELAPTPEPLGTPAQVERSKLAALAFEERIGKLCR